MPYQSHIQVVYRFADDEEMPDGLTVHVKDRPGAQAEILWRRGHACPSLPAEMTRQSSHLVIHGRWRQTWTDDGRMERPALGLLLGVSRWESVPSHLMPPGHAIFPIEEDGSCVWAVDEDCHTRQLRNDMNDMLLRLAGDGLWNQHWPKNRPPFPGEPPPPQLAPAATSPVTA